MISYEHLVSIACSVVKRRYRALWERYKEDCKQEAHLLVLYATSISQLKNNSDAQTDTFIK